MLHRAYIGAVLALGVCIGQPGYAQHPSVRRVARLARPCVPGFPRAPYSWAVCQAWTGGLAPIRVPKQVVLPWQASLQGTLLRPHLNFVLPGRMFPGKAEVDAVIFDLDGTLLNSLSAWEHSGSNFVRSQGFEPPDSLDEELVAMSLMDGANLIKTRYQLPYSPEEILQMTLRPIEAHYEQDILPMPGVPALLAQLRAQGVKMAVATASDRKLAEVSLRRLGLLAYFEFIITCDEVGVGKSSPKVYEAALKRLGTTKARTLVAEDALHALQTAHAAGFPTAAIEEPHSAHQRKEKKQAATYYVLSYQGQNVFTK